MLFDLCPLIKHDFPLGFQLQSLTHALTERTHRYQKKKKNPVASEEYCISTYHLSGKMLWSVCNLKYIFLTEWTNDRHIFLSKFNDIRWHISTHILESNQQTFTGWIYHARYHVRSSEKIKQKFSRNLQLRRQ